MKKAVSMFLTAALAVSCLAGCGSSAGNTSTGNEQTAAHQTTVQQTTVQQTVLYLRSEASDRQPVMQQFTETQL